MSTGETLSNRSRCGEGEILPLPEIALAGGQQICWLSWSARKRYGYHHPKNSVFKTNTQFRYNPYKKLGDEMRMDRRLVELPRWVS